MLSRNGYIKEVIEARIKHFLNKIYDNNSKSPVFGSEKFKVFIKLPYIAVFSGIVRNSKNSCLRKIKCGRVELKFLSSFSRLSDMFKFKDKQPKALASNVVYQITCDCGFRYIGKTCRNLLVRFNEHIRTSGPNLSEVAKHILCNKTCQVNFGNCKVLCTKMINMYEN